MLVRFWIEGLPPSTGEEEEVHWFDKIKYYISPLIFEDSKNPGAFVPKPTIPKKVEAIVLPVEEISWRKWVEKGLRNGARALFGGIIPVTTESGKSGTTQSGLFKRVMRPKPGEHWTGEAHAELKKVNLFVLGSSE